ncbi:hypothetical protein Lalb_Chr06g0172691 [Lupinus albus]|uniref:Uncharacterized protein n=1 Tax=Lupinus albus TaxID=3870 RepID=A0A6A4QGN4_LUPAL|nr:hypothetical protein Lalb_Chr06g0172691 [Lupinus albus]
MVDTSEEGNAYGGVIHTPPWHHFQSPFLRFKGIMLHQQTKIDRQGIMHQRLHQNTKGSKVRHTYQMRQGVHQTLNSSVRMLAIHQHSRSRLNTSALELDMKGRLGSCDTRVIYFVIHV